MKVCKICEQSLPEINFYKRNENKDGLDDYCKTCRLEYNRESRARNGSKSQMPRSTADAMMYLMNRGILVTTGYKGNEPGEDIKAFNFIIIEAKGAEARDGKHYTWGWTKAQKEKQKRDYIMLIAYNGSAERYFIVPANHPMFALNSQKLCVSFGSQHWANGKRWDLELLKYEDAHRQIFDDMRRYIEEHAEQ